MKCPDCNTVLIEKQVVKKSYRIDIDECVKCGGLWFDANELEEYRASVLSTSEYTILPKFEPITAIDSAECCRCEQNTLMHYNVGLHVIRRCLNCSGIFVDKAQISELVRKGNVEEDIQVGLAVAFFEFFLGMLH